MPAPTAVTIGNFDGVHIGHAALIRRAREIVSVGGEQGRVVAMTFDPHPLSRLRPESAPARLTTLEQRVELLLRAGADDVVHLKPSPDLLALSAQEFIERVARANAPKAIIEGPDFRFGKARQGDVRVLAELGSRLGFTVEVIDPVLATLTDQAQVPASSSVARWLIENGRVRDAAIVLGRPYEMVGEVAPGDQRGRLIGCPTANLETDQLPPRDGIYAGIATLPDGRAYPAAISVGDKPTFGGTRRAVEAHLLGWNGDLREAESRREDRASGAMIEAYAWRLRLSIVHWLRDQLRYDSVDALMQQIRRDIARCADLIGGQDREGPLSGMREEAAA